MSIEDEIQGDNISLEKPKGIKNIAKQLLGAELYGGIRKLLKNEREGNMSVDVGHN